VTKYRVYLNCFEEAPLIWSVDSGAPDSEIKVRDVVFIGVSGITGSEASQVPKCWLEVEAELAIRNDVAIFTTLWSRHG
jgi:hypothetical protein